MKLDSEKILKRFKNFCKNAKLEERKDDFVDSLIHCLNYMKKEGEIIEDKVKEFGSECERMGKKLFEDIIGDCGLKNDNKRIAYIASPVKLFFKKHIEDKYLGNEYAYLKALENVKLFRKKFGNDYIPISAPLMFLKVYDENTEREEAFDAGLEILKMCDVFAYRVDDYSESEGIKKELELAKRIEIETIRF